jgi:hypothetical protein
MRPMETRQIHRHTLTLYKLARNGRPGDKNNIIHIVAKDSVVVIFLAKGCEIRKRLFLCSYRRYFRSHASYSEM